MPKPSHQMKNLAILQPPQQPSPTHFVPDDDNDFDIMASLASSSTSDEDYDPLNDNKSGKRKKAMSAKKNNKQRSGFLICRHEGCHYASKYFYNLCAHDRTHNDNQLPYSCQFCKGAKQTKDQSYILRHIRQEHSAELAKLYPRETGAMVKKAPRLMQHVDVDKKMLDEEKKQMDLWLNSEECKLKTMGKNTNSTIRNTIPKLSPSGTSQFPSTSTSQTISSSSTTTTIYSCPECGKYSFENYDNLSRHYRTKHSQIKPFTCKFSDCSFSGAFKENMERHFIKFHKTKNKSFMLSHVDVDEEAIACEENKLKQWLEAVEVIKVPSSVSERPSPTAVNSTKVLQSSTAIAPTETAVVNSTNLHSTTASSLAESIGPLVICSTPREDGFLIFICQRPNCQQEFRNLTNFKRHDRIHRKIYPWRCRVCDTLFNRQDKARNHIWENHFIPKSGKKASKNTETSFANFLLKNLEEKREILMQENELFKNAIRITLPAVADDEIEDEAFTDDDMNSDANSNNDLHDNSTNCNQSEEEDDESLEILEARLNELELKYPFECRLGCEWAFSSESDRRTHENEHLAIEAYQCHWPFKSSDENDANNICGRRFLRASFTSDHIKVDHLSEEENDSYIDQFIWTDQELLDSC